MLHSIVCVLDMEEFNRREVLKTMGVTAITGTIMSQSGAAQKQLQQSEVEFEKIETHLKLGRIIGITTSSAEYRDLRNHFEEEFDGTPKPGFATVLKAINPENREVAGYVVNIPVHGVRESDIAGISATISNGNVDKVTGSRRITREDGTVDIDLFKREKQSVETQNIVYNPNKGDHHQSDTSERNDSVHLQGLLPSKCTVCKSLYNAANSTGCGVTAAMLCAAAGFGTAGGALTICTPMVPAFCAVYNEYQNANGMSAENLCGDGIPDAPDSGLGYC